MKKGYTVVPLTKISSDLSRCWRRRAECYINGIDKGFGQYAERLGMHNGSPNEIMYRIGDDR